MVKPPELTTQRQALCAEDTGTTRHETGPSGERIRSRENKSNRRKYVQMLCKPVHIRKPLAHSEPGLQPTGKIWESRRGVSNPINHSATGTRQQGQDAPKDPSKTPAPSRPRFELRRAETQCATPQNGFPRRHERDIDRDIALNPYQWMAAMRPSQSKIGQQLGLVTYTRYILHRSGRMSVPHPSRTRPTRFMKLGWGPAPLARFWPEARDACRL